MANQRHEYFEPESFPRAVQDMLSDDLLIRLRQTMGGRTYNFPRVTGDRLPDDNVLVVSVGREDAERLIDIFGGERAYIPRRIDNRDQVIRDAVAAGLTVHEIAAKVAVTERHMYRLLRDMGLRTLPQPAKKAHALVDVSQ